MTYSGIAAEPRHLTVVARRPGAVVGRQAARRAVRSGAMWGVVFALFVIVQTHAYTATYPTQAARNQLLSAYGTNLGLNALLGRAGAINTVAGFVAWRFLGILGVFGVLWGLLTSTRLMRGEEDAGRYELLQTGATTRRRAAAQSLAGLGAGLCALFVVTALGVVVTGRGGSVGFAVGQSLYFAVTLVSGAAVFLAVGAFSSQLAATRRQAATLGGVAFAVCFAVRMVADSDASLRWMVWLSPLGWIEQSRPLTDPDPLALLPVLVLISALLAGTLYLAGIRDVGAATLPSRDSSRPRLALLSGPFGLAARLIRPVAAGWLLGVAAYAALLGSVAESSVHDSTGSSAVQQGLGRLGGHGSEVRAYLGLTFLLVALLAALIAAGQITAIREEEGSGRLESLIVRPVSRIRWLVERLALAALVVTAAGIVSGLGVWAGSAGQRGAPGLGPLLAAGLNTVPPALVLLGVGACAFAAWPRHAAAAVYGYLAWSFLIEFTGAIVRTNHWLMDTSVFFHMLPAPATGVNWTGAAMLTGLGLLSGLCGAVLLNRRDLYGD